MTEQGTVPATAQKITPHIVVHDGAAAVDWYRAVLGAREGLRIELPNGKLLVELRFGEALMLLADEFPGMGIVSPRTLGGTYMALYLTVGDVDAVWDRALEAGAEVFVPLGDSFWGSPGADHRSIWPSLGLLPVHPGDPLGGDQGGRDGGVRGLIVIAALASHPNRGRHARSEIA